MTHLTDSKTTKLNHSINSTLTTLQPKKKKQKSLMTIRNDIINIKNDKHTFKTLTAHEQPHNVTQHHINKHSQPLKPQTPY